MLNPMTPQEEAYHAVKRLRKEIDLIIASLAATLPKAEPHKRKRVELIPPQSILDSRARAATKKKKRTTA